MNFQNKRVSILFWRHLQTKVMTHKWILHVFHFIENFQIFYSGLWVIFFLFKSRTFDYNLHSLAWLVKISNHQRMQKFKGLKLLKFKEEGEEFESSSFLDSPPLLESWQWKLGSSPLAHILLTLSTLLLFTWSMNFFLEAFELMALSCFSSIWSIL